MVTMLISGRRDGPERRVEGRRLAAPGGAGDEDEAVRAREELLRDSELRVEHAELREAPEHRLRVEDAEDELLAERGVNGRHAQLDLAVAARGLDAAVLGAPLLGDVEAGERLDARHDRAVDRLRERVHRVEDAVDAHAHGRLVASRLDVDVGRALVERIVEDVLDGRDDVRVARLDLLDARQRDELLEVRDVDPARDLHLRGGHRAAEAVEVGDEALDFARRRDDQARVPPHEVRQVVDEPHVERVRHGHRDVPFVGGDDERRVLARERAREELRRELRVDLERVEIDERVVQRLRERLHDDPLVQRIALVAVDREPHEAQHLGGVDVLSGLQLGDRRATRPEEPRALDVVPRSRVPFLRRCEELRVLEKIAEKVEREAGLNGHAVSSLEDRPTFYDCGKFRLHARPNVRGHALTGARREAAGRVALGRDGRCEDDEHQVDDAHTHPGIRSRCALRPPRSDWLHGVLLGQSLERHERAPVRAPSPHRPRARGHHAPRRHRPPRARRAPVRAPRARSGAPRPREAHRQPVALLQPLRRAAERSATRSPSRSSTRAPPRTTSG